MGLLTSVVRGLSLHLGNFMQLKIVISNFKNHAMKRYVHFLKNMWMKHLHPDLIGKACLLVLSEMDSSIIVRNIDVRKTWFNSRY